MRHGVNVIDVDDGNVESISIATASGDGTSSSVVHLEDRDITALTAADET
jgi:hypothetical protein